MVSAPAAPQGKHSVHQDCRAISQLPVLEILEEMSLATGSKNGVLPAEVQSKKVVDQIDVSRDIGPSLGWKAHAEAHAEAIKFGYANEHLAHWESSGQHLSSESKMQPETAPVAYRACGWQTTIPQHQTDF